MVFALVFFLNAAANFGLGIALGAILGPTEFGRFATVALGATTLGVALFDWLRLSSMRFYAASEGRAVVSSSLEASYLAMIVAAVAVTGGVIALGATYGLAPALVALTPLMALAYARSDYTAAQMRARRQARAYAALAGVRHTLTFTVVIAVALWTRSAGAALAALVGATLVSLIAVGPAMRTPGAALKLADRASIRRFVVYAQPIVASTILYLVILFVDRQFALRHFGAAATGKLSLATDLGFRLFLAINFLPETLLFQRAVEREAEEGREAADAQAAVNIVLSLAILAPLAAGYVVMAPTFEALFAPPAFRGDFARLSVSLAPGFFAYCALMSTCNPIFQLGHRTWPLTLAALAALGANLALLATPAFSSDIDGVAKAFAVSLWVGLATAVAAAVRLHKARPSPRDLAVVAAATLAMSVSIKPLNALHPPALAALVALLTGGAIYAGAALGFDVGGCRAIVAARVKASSRPAAPETPP